MTMREMVDMMCEPQAHTQTQGGIPSAIAELNQVSVRSAELLKILSDKLATVVVPTPEQENKVCNEGMPCGGSDLAVSIREPTEQISANLSDIIRLLDTLDL